MARIRMRDWYWAATAIFTAQPRMAAVVMGRCSRSPRLFLRSFEDDQFDFKQPTLHLICVVRSLFLSLVRETLCVSRGLPGLARYRNCELELATCWPQG